MSEYTHKIVDGVAVSLTPEEIDEFEARDVAWENRSEPVPTSITKLQLVRALREADLKAAFDAVMGAAAAETQEDWSLAVEVMRDDPLVEQIGIALGLGSDGIDALFVSASNI